MSQFRDVLILLNILVVAGILGFVAYRIISLRRNPEEKEPQNLERFYDDDVLEGPHLERVLGVALVALVIATVAFIAYFIWEPFRGADATKSLLCANCHGLDGGGGSAAFVVKSEDTRCDPDQTVNDDLAAKQPYCL